MADEYRQLETGSQTDRYSRVAMTLHWLIAAAFLFQIGLGWKMGGTHAPDTYTAFQLHKSIGITILLLTLARIAWRLSHRPPPFPANMTTLERGLAHGVHFLFYLLLLGMPLSGWLIVSSSKIAVQTYLYSTVPWPHIPGIASLAPATKAAVNAVAGSAHELMVWVALAGIVLHVAGALKHQFLEHGPYLARMLPAPHRALGVAGILAVLAGLGMLTLGRSITLAAGGRTSTASTAPAAPPPAADNAGDIAADNSANAASAPAAEESANASAAANVTQAGAQSPVWAVRMKASSIRFHSNFSMGAIDGSFGAWRADISFDPEALDAAKASVTIDMVSATAADTDQKAALPEADWFAVASHPTATWRATRFRHSGGARYVADGTLTLRGVSRPLAIPFTLKIDGDVATMSGTATIDRTAFGVGQGDWATTADLPANVAVSIAIKADRVKKP